MYPAILLRDTGRFSALTFCEKLFTMSRTLVLRCTSRVLRCTSGRMVHIGQRRRQDRIVERGFLCVCSNRTSGYLQSILVTSRLLGLPPWPWPWTLNVEHSNTLDLALHFDWPFRRSLGAIRNRRLVIAKIVRRWRVAVDGNHYYAFCFDPGFISWSTFLLPEQCAPNSSSFIPWRLVGTNLNHVFGQS